MKINLQDGNQIHRMDQWHMQQHLLARDKDCMMQIWTFYFFFFGLLDMILCPEVVEICRWLVWAQQISDEVRPAVFFHPLWTGIFGSSTFFNSHDSSSLWTATLIFSHVFFAHVAPTENIKSTSPLWLHYERVLPLSCHCWSCSISCLSGKSMRELIKKKASFCGKMKLMKEHCLNLMQLTHTDPDKQRWTGDCVGGVCCLSTAAC